MRGYGVDSFSAGECASSESCPTFDRLVGSRMLVGNIEFRFPLLRPFGVDRTNLWTATCRSRVLPRRRRHVEEGRRPSFFNGGTREPVTSGGITLRTNLSASPPHRSITRDRSIGQDEVGLGMLAHPWILRKVQSPDRAEG